VGVSERPRGMWPSEVEVDLDGLSCPGLRGFYFV